MHKTTNNSNRRFDRRLWRVFYIVFDCSSWKYQIQRYTELFKNVYGPEIENPKDGMEKEREVIKTLIKEGLGMLNKARSQALFLDDIEMQEDITNL